MVRMRLATNSNTAVSSGNGEVPVARESILELAESVFLKDGFAATTMEGLLGQLDDSLKPQLQEHFADKKQLALVLINRYVERDLKYFADLQHRAQFLCSDPLQQLILFVNLLAESICDKPKAEHGCLLAVFARDQNVLETEIKQVLAKGLEQWRESFLIQLRTVCEIYPPCIDVPLEDLADMLTTVLEGGIVLSLLQNDPQALSSQVINYRNYLRLLFEPAA